MDLKAGWGGAQTRTQKQQTTDSYEIIFVVKNKSRKDWRTKGRILKEKKLWGEFFMGWEAERKYSTNRVGDRRSGDCTHHYLMTPDPRNQRKN